MRSRSDDFDIVDVVGSALTINVSCASYDPRSGVVTTLVAWQLPASAAGVDRTGRTAWNSTILVEYQTPDGPHVSAHRTTSHSIQLSLAVDHLYGITVRHCFLYRIRFEAIVTTGAHDALSTLVWL